jgi:DNA-binding CsgD family transcriptional regulator
VSPNGRTEATAPRDHEKEAEVLKLIAEGLQLLKSRKNFSKPPLTIETHRHNIMAKLKAKNIASLIRIAVGRKLVYFFLL